ncbi:MAG TPA: glycosyltransferase [Thermoanaerobaculia bacterium]|jgi:glycosyltransferase involved in cell wall biosynthesis
MNPHDEVAARLAAAEERIRVLEAALAVKEREVVEIHRSRAWRFAGAFRTLKHRYVDPLLRVFGIRWPRVAASPMADVQPRISSATTYDILCLSTCDWDARFQRPQQLMALYAAAGHRVFYVSQRLRREGRPWAAVTKRDGVYEVTLSGDGAQAVDALRRDVGISAAVTIVHWPSWWPLAREARKRFGWTVVYDCMDLHSGFASVSRDVVRQEAELLAGADAVVVSSAALERHALQQRREAFVIRNGCDVAHFAKTPPANNVRPVVGYYGAIAEWFDAALVAELAARRPDWDFVLVGSTYGGAVSRLAKLPNVFLPGEQAYETLPEWLGRFDVAIVPFLRNPLTEATNPVKVYEMLAGGKPVVSVPIPEVAALAPLVRLASTVEEFSREIEAALAEPAELAEQRREFAREQSWERRFAELAAVTARVSKER